MTCTSEMLDRAQTLIDNLEPIVLEGRLMAFRMTPEFLREGPELMRLMILRLRELDAR